ncbi:hypothetical protein K1719_009689 [Acacia pycnantha]|nr:hypothetical protein K1719_009689 [Acacia pycnantha]
MVEHLMPKFASEDYEVQLKNLIEALETTSEEEAIKIEALGKPEADRTRNNALVIINGKFLGRLVQRKIKRSGLERGSNALNMDIVLSCRVLFFYTVMSGLNSTIMQLAKGLVK